MSGLGCGRAGISPASSRFPGNQIIRTGRAPCLAGGAGNLVLAGVSGIGVTRPQPERLWPRLPKIKEMDAPAVWVPYIYCLNVWGARERVLRI